MKAGDTITVMADALSRHGDGVGDVDGTEVHVAGLLPGETADVAIDYVSRHHPRAHGTVVKRRNAHPGRREAPCIHHGRCNGCPLMEMNVASQRDLKQKSLAKHHRIRIDRLVSTEDDGLHYRWSSKRVFAGKPGALVLGSYIRGTHKVADMQGCLVDHPDVVAAATELVEVANALRVPAYNEVDEFGDLRYAWFKTDGRGHVILAIVTGDPIATSVFDIAERLTRPVGIAWGVNAAKSNDMRGTTLRPIRGQQSLEVDLCGVSVQVGPQGFLQPNPVTASMAYHDLVRVPAGGSPHGRLALDLYAGAGITTELLRANYDVVVPCESYPESARALGVAPSLVEEFLADIIGGGQHPHHSPDLVVANPPRGGFGPTVCEQLNRLHAPRLHIMSCSAVTLAEDLRRLCGPHGAYRLVGARAFDTLPQTAHIEIVAWLVGRDRAWP